MTDIKDLELRIKSAESTLEMLRGELEELRQQQQPEPKPESLFGRWATHPERGRGIIISDKRRFDGKVTFSWKDDTAEDGASELWLSIEDLTLDPATLTTQQDYQDAPVGTIVTNAKDEFVWVKHDGYWHASGFGRISSANLAKRESTSRVIRWG